MSPWRVTATISLALTAGCSSLQPVPVEFITEATPSAVRIWDGHRTVEITNPRLSGDTVVGTTLGTEVAIPLRRVQQIRTVRFSSGRTALLTGGVALLGGLAAYAFLTGANGHNNFACDYNEPTQNNEKDPCDFTP